MIQSMMCPQCNAPLAPHRLAKSVVCSYCGATIRIEGTSIKAATFHDAYRIWNSPSSHGYSSWISLGESHWAMDQRIAMGEIADVYSGWRARWPTEMVIIKILRDQRDSSRFNNEWENLQKLSQSAARGAATFTALLPQPVLHGEISSGQHIGKLMSIFRWESGFEYNMEEVIQAYPQGIEPRASIWVWRRILEMLNFIHTSGMIHGAVLPPHLLIQNNEHGIRLIGYGCSGQAGTKLRSVSPDYNYFYPDKMRKSLTLTPGVDLAMSAQCIIALLGGDPVNVTLPDSVPAPLVDILKHIANYNSPQSGKDAWAIREELGVIADKVYGPPKFIPIVMPS
jgi:hypothetical protein